MIERDRKPGAGRASSTLRPLSPLKRSRRCCRSCPDPEVGTRASLASRRRVKAGHVARANSSLMFAKSRSPEQVPALEECKVRASRPAPGSCLRVEPSGKQKPLERRPVRPPSIRTRCETAGYRGLDRPAFRVMQVRRLVHQDARRDLNAGAASDADAPPAIVGAYSTRAFADAFPPNEATSREVALHGPVSAVCTRAMARDRCPRRRVSLCRRRPGSSGRSPGPPGRRRPRAPMRWRPGWD